ncbi:MAG: gamma-glutamyl-gamma-aminobutyrate hydrolase family protein [Lysinibacillus sp.]
MKPVIALTMFVEDDLSVRLNAAYSKCVVEAGGIPLLVPLGVDADVKQILTLVDGLLLTGGHDIHPFIFGEEPRPKLGKICPERDAVEILLTQEAISRKKPIFGICRGQQLLNVALGGSLYQDIEAEHVSSRPLMHTQVSARAVKTHYVTFSNDNLLKQIVGEEKIAVNSFHHQSVKIIADTLNVAAKSSDGVIEALVHETLPFCLSVQWHPEELAIAGDEVSKKLFKAFVEACRINL